MTPMHQESLRRPASTEGRDTRLPSVRQASQPHETKGEALETARASSRSDENIIRQYSSYKDALENTMNAKAREG